MPAENYSTFFTAACGSDRQPYGYQCRLACGEEARAEDESILRTGLGKTFNIF